MTSISRSAREGVIGGLRDDVNIRNVANGLTTLVPAQVIRGARQSVQI